MWWSGDIWKKNPAPRLLHFTGQVVAPFPTAIAELHQISNGECRSQMWPMLSKFPLHFGGGIFYFFPFTSFTSSTWLLRCLLHSWSRSGHWDRRDVSLCKRKVARRMPDILADRPSYLISDGGRLQEEYKRAVGAFWFLIVELIDWSIGL